MDTNGFCVVGKISGCFGLQGYLKIQPLSPKVERFRQLYKVFIGYHQNSSREYAVDDVIVKGKGILIKFDSVNDRTSAEKLIGSYLFVKDNERIKLPKGHYFIDEIVGCEVLTDQNKKIGFVKEVLQFTAQDLWVILDGEKEYWVPAVKEFIRLVDTKNKKIVVHVIDGLLEL